MTTWRGSDCRFRSAAGVAVIAGSPGSGPKLFTQVVTMRMSGTISLIGVYAYKGDPMSLGSSRNSAIAWAMTL